MSWRGIMNCVILLMKGGNEIMDYFKRFGVLSGLILIALGIVCYVFKNQVIAFFGLAVGIIVFVAGGYFLAGALVMRKNSGELPTIKLVCGILMLLCGIYLMGHTTIMIRIVGVFIGVMAFAAGVDRFSVASARSRAGLDSNKNVLFGIVHILFGVLMCIVPIWGVDVLVMFTGLYLILAGIMVLLSSAKYHDL